MSNQRFSEGERVEVFARQVAADVVRQARGAEARVCRVRKAARHAAAAAGEPLIASARTGQLETPYEWRWTETERSGPKPGDEIEVRWSSTEWVRACVAEIGRGWIAVNDRGIKGTWYDGEWRWPEAEL